MRCIALKRVLFVLLGAGVWLSAQAQTRANEEVAIELPSPEQVLKIPDRLREEFRQKVLVANAHEQRLYRLVDFMFKPDGLGLQYDPAATGTVAESYQHRKVNCLAATLMVVALAREAGLVAYPQQISRVVDWEMQRDVVMQVMHVNAVVVVAGRKFMVDIASRQLGSLPVVDYRISDAHMLALFYGNRAMNLLAAGDLMNAQRWQMAALQLEGGDATLWNNAGLLSQRLGDVQRAEQMFLTAIKENGRLSSPLLNLVALYRKTGNTKALVYWQARSQSILRKDPYYQYMQGALFERSGDYANAIVAYQQAISLYEKEAVFHASLARVYCQTRNMSKAHREWSLARQAQRSC